MLATLKFICKSREYIYSRLSTSKYYSNIRVSTNCSMFISSIRLQKIAQKIHTYYTNNHVGAHTHTHTHLYKKTIMFYVAQVSFFVLIFSNFLFITKHTLLACISRYHNIEVMQYTLARTKRRIHRVAAITFSSHLVNHPIPMSHTLLGIEYVVLASSHPPNRALVFSSLSSLPRIHSLTIPNQKPAHNIITRSSP